jgi:hypothetical protein
MDPAFPFLPPVPEPLLDPEARPDFIVAGVPKSGSSSLARYLGQHPGIFFSDLKEPDYFRTDDLRFVYRDPDRRVRGKNLAHIAMRTSEWYQSHFRAAQPGQVRGEASVGYFYGGRDTARRIHAGAPDVKLLFILRQPADRAYSNYLHQRRAAQETLSFPASLAIEARRLAAPMHSFWGYRAHGYYHDRLAAFLDVFGRDRVKVMLHDDWRDPAAFLREVFVYLGVDPAVSVDTRERHNVGRVPLAPFLARRLPPAVSYALRDIVPARAWRTAADLLKRLRRVNLRPAPPLDPALRRALTADFRADILKTQALIGRDLSPWLA